jgi:hypothetical protein
MTIAASVVQAAPIPNKFFGIEPPLIIQHRPLTDRPLTPVVVPPPDMFDLNRIARFPEYVPGEPVARKGTVPPWQPWIDAYRRMLNG